MSASEQAAAVETARRYIVGAAKLPKANSSEAKYLAQKLEEAARAIRETSDVRA